MPGFQRMAHFTMPWIFSTSPPFGTCSSKKHEMFPLPKLVSERRRAIWNPLLRTLCERHVSSHLPHAHLSPKGIIHGGKGPECSHLQMGAFCYQQEKRGLNSLELVHLFELLHPRKCYNKPKLRNRGKQIESIPLPSETDRLL